MILRPVRTSQPQGPARIDWSNPNAEGLLGSWVGSGRGKAAFGTDAVPQGNAVAKIGQAGVGLSNTDTGSNNFWKVERGTTYTYTQQVTFEAVIEVDSFTSNAPYISGIIAQYVQPGSSADDRGPFLRFGNGSSENRDKPFFAVMQSNAERGVLGPSLQTGRKYHLLGTYDGSTVKLFIDGVLIGTTAATGSFENGNNAYLAIGTDYPGTSSNEFRALQGRVYLANVYGIGKTDAQAKSLAANPWQIFAPDSKSLWVPETVSAGGGATVIPIGVQATGSVGTPSVTGAANALPAGVSATASVGTPVAVGGASIPATALPAGIAASSAVGTPVATGAALAQPVGVSAVSAVGTPVAIGETVGVTVVYPEGVQAQGYVGTLSATAAAVVIPIGVQAVGEVGDVLAYAGDEPPVVASSNYGFEMSAGKRYYIKRKGKILLFNSAEQADEYLATEQQATVVKSRGAKKRIAAKLVKVAPIETIELEPVTELLSRYMPDVSLPNLLKMRDIEQVLKMQQQALLMQDDEDIELLLMTL